MASYNYVGTMVSYRMDNDSVLQHQVLNPFLGGHNSSCARSGNSIYIPEFETN